MTTTSPATTLTMRSVIGTYFMKLANQIGKRWAGLIASEFNTDQPFEQYPWLDAVPALRKWEGERAIQELNSQGITIFNDEYERTLAFKLPDFRRDKTPQINARVGDLATRVATHPERLITTLLTANGNAYDGAPFFSTSRVNGKSGTTNNALTTSDGLAGGAAPTVAQMANNLLIAMAQLQAFLDNEGEPFNESARDWTVMVPANLYGVTVTAKKASFTDNGATNPLSEIETNITVIENARLTTKNQFFMFRSDAEIKALILQEEETKPMEMGPQSEYAKLHNKVLFGHGWSGGVGYGLPQLALRGTT